MTPPSAFLGPTALRFTISVIAMVVFHGLPTWDTRATKAQYADHLGAKTDMKMASAGAISLYLYIQHHLVVVLG